MRELRGTLIPQAFDGSGASVYVTGQTAGNLDYIDIVNSYFPWVVALVLSLSFLLLLVAFRSIVIPLKAILMNLLSVGAAYGLVTLVSLKGWGAGLLGFQQVPVVEQWVPLLLFAVLFGLSMDYQVFLLSRIKEAWDRTGDNTLAVTEGVGATAGIITGAALIMVAVFAGFAAGDLVMFQQMGFGLAVAVLLDATLIRTHPGAGGDEAARPLELVPAELARVAAAPEHRGCAGGAVRWRRRRAGRTGAGRPGPRAAAGGRTSGLSRHARAGLASAGAGRRGQDRLRRPAPTMSLSRPDPFAVSLAGLWCRPRRCNAGNGADTERVVVPAAGTVCDSAVPSSAPSAVLLRNATLPVRQGRRPAGPTAARHAAAAATGLSAPARLPRRRPRARRA